MSLKSMVTVPAGSPIWALCWPFVQVASLRGQPSVLTFPTSNTLSSGSGAGGLLDLVSAVMCTRMRRRVTAPSEVLKLTSRRVLNQIEEIGAGRRQRPADVVLA